MARRLAADGHDLVIVARGRERLETLARDLDGNHGVAVEVLPADLTDGSDLATVEARVADYDRPVDVLVNNAGFGTVGEFADMPIDREASEIALNVTALVRITHAAIVPMRERGSGKILNVSSLAAQQPTAGMATYGATKAFVTSFTLAVREEVRGSGVVVTVLCPGFTRTEFQVRAGGDKTTVPGPLSQSADQVAKAGLEALAKGHAVVVSGWPNWVAAKATRVVPAGLTRRVAGFVMRRGADG